MLTLKNSKLHVWIEICISMYPLRALTWPIRNFQFFAQFIKKLLDPLKLSDIIPVFEKLSHSNEANSRTVSILPFVSKKFEKIMYDKLYEYKENFLNQQLCGFRAAISPIPTFTKTSKELDWGVYWYNFNRLLKSLGLLASWFI